MGKWAQARHRGGGGFGNTLLPAPELLAEAGRTVSWTWLLPDPDNWMLEESLDGTTGWTAFAFPAPFDRSVQPVTIGNFYRLVGLDADNNPSTGYSNVVEGLA